MVVLSFRAYVELTKPRIAFLNVLTAVTALIVASYPVTNYVGLLVLAVVGYLAAGGCGAVNCFFDRDIDGIMERTSRRAIPSGRISPASRALVLGTLMIGGSLVLSALFFNLLTALFVSLGVVIYVGVYTLWLKRRSPWNIVIGGAAGSCAPLAGWAAAVGGVGLTALLLAFIIFLWTPGHFWGLAIRAKNSYQKAGIPMLPVLVGERKAGRYTAYSNFAVVPFSILLIFLEQGGLTLVLSIVVLSVLLIYENIKLYVRPEPSQAWQVFKFSVPWLAVLMVSLVLDKFIAI